MRVNQDAKITSQRSDKIQTNMKTVIRYDKLNSHMTNNDKSYTNVRLQWRFE